MEDSASNNPAAAATGMLPPAEEEQKGTDPGEAQEQALEDFMYVPLDNPRKAPCSRSTG